MKKCLAVIPARLGSTRLPEKLIKVVQGKTIIQHTWENAKKFPGFEDILIATDHDLIYQECLKFGANVVMTDVNCPNGTHRVAKALQQFPSKADYIMNVQGDEPCVSIETFQALLSLCQEKNDVVMATPVTPLKEKEQIESPSCVKCVFDKNGKALYFSRLPIPYLQKKELPQPNYYRHLGIYCFRRDFLDIFCHLPPTPLQISEDLEQLKVLEHGYPIHIAVVHEEGIGVDTLSDLEHLEKLLCNKNTFSLPEASSPRLAKD